MMRNPKSIRCLLSGVLLLVSAAGASNAQTITFGALPGESGDFFTGPYSEAGYAVTLLSGTICVGKIFGNPIPNLFGGLDCDHATSATPATLSIKKIDGGLFYFVGADLATEVGSASYTFAGFLAAVSQYSAGGVLPITDTFDTYAGSAPGTSIDELRILLNGNDAISYNIDNIQLSASTVVPEPASFLLMAAGLAGLTYVQRKRRT